MMADPLGDVGDERDDGGGDREGRCLGGDYGLRLNPALRNHCQALGSDRALLYRAVHLQYRR